MGVVRCWGSAAPTMRCGTDRVLKTHRATQMHNAWPSNPRCDPLVQLPACPAATDVRLPPHHAPQLPPACLTCINYFPLCNTHKRTQRRFPHMHACTQNRSCLLLPRSARPGRPPRRAHLHALAAHGVLQGHHLMTNQQLLVLLLLFSLCRAARHQPPHVRHRGRQRLRGSHVRLDLRRAGGGASHGT